MPRKITRDEVIRRIAMHALLDGVPRMTQVKMTRLFHASYTTVALAKAMSMDDLASLLETSPDPRHHTGQPERAGPPPSHARARPGDRRNATLMVPDPEPAVPDEDAGWKDDRDVVAIDPLDNPRPGSKNTRLKHQGG